MEKENRNIFQIAMEKDKLRAEEQESRGEASITKAQQKAAIEAAQRINLAPEHGGTVFHALEAKRVLEKVNLKLDALDTPLQENVARAIEG